jgi:hypothetical protein
MLRCSDFDLSGRAKSSRNPISELIFLYLNFRTTAVDIITTTYKSIVYNFFHTEVRQPFAAEAFLENLSVVL